MISAAFASLLNTTAHHSLSLQEYEDLDLPANADRKALWDDLWIARRAQAIYYRDIETIDGRQVDEWYTPTWSIQYKLRLLEKKTREGSPLDLALNERFGRRFVVKPLIDETVAAAACDGIHISYETVQGLATGDYEPRDAHERVVANVHALLADVVSDPCRPITPESIEKMYRKIIEGADEGDIHTELSWGLEWPVDPIPHDRVLEEICGLASLRLADTYDHPILLGQRVCCKVWKFSPFPCCNYLLGSILSRQALKNAGYPVFAWVPSSRLTLDWKSGGRSGGDVYPYAESGIIRPYDMDWTPYWESCLALLVEDVEELEQHVLDLKRRDEELVEGIKLDRSLNYRQQEVLGRVLISPRDEIRISDHQQAFGLAYSTARQDLVGLVERGLLHMRYECRAQVFMARPDLKSTLARKYAQRDA